MKKLLAVILAALTLFSVLGVSASAFNESYYSDYFKPFGPVSSEQVILSFDLNGGTLKETVNVYQNGSWSLISGYTGIYTKIPENPTSQCVGQLVRLPMVTPPSGSAFLGWYCYEDNITYAPGHNYKIPAGKEGNVIDFYAYYAPAEAEEDTFGTILGILVKVFGAISGIVIYNGDTEKGIALFDKILGALDF